MGHFFRALKFSRDGFRTLLKEQAFRQELCLVAIGLPVAFYFRGFCGFLAVLPWGLALLAVEALNTAIERTIDLCTEEWKELAKQAKDCASFACAAAIAAFIVVVGRTILF